MWTSPPTPLLRRGGLIQVFPLVTCLLLLISCTHWKVQKTETKHFAITEPEVDSQIVKMILPYKTTLDEKMNVVIGFAPEALIKKLPESNLGNFFSDAMYQRAMQIQNTDTAHLVAMFNSGGLRTSVPEGEIRVRNMFELMPFENELVLLPIKGSQLQIILNGIADKGGAPLAGVRFKIANHKAEDIFVHQIALDTNIVYTITTSDYLANGGDKFFNIETLIPITIGVTKTNLLLRDILIDYCQNLYKQNKTITGAIDGRISTAK